MLVDNLGNKDLLLRHHGALPRVRRQFRTITSLKSIMTVQKMIESEPDGGNPSDHASPILHMGAGTSRLSTHQEIHHGLPVGPTRISYQADANAE